MPVMAWTSSQDLKLALFRDHSTLLLGNYLVYRHQNGILNQGGVEHSFDTWISRSEQHRSFSDLKTR